MDAAVVVAPGGQEYSARTLDMPRLGQLFRRYAALIVVLALLGGVGAYAYALSLPKEFTSSGAVAVEGDRFVIPDLQGAVAGANAPDPMPWVRTEMQALTSRELVQGVADKLHLVDSPEFNPALNPPTLVQRAKDAIKAMLPQPATTQGDVGPQEQVLQAAQRALSVTQDNRSLVIGVAFTARDPRLAAGFVNNLIHDYLAERSGRRTSADQGAHTILTQRIDQVRSELDGIEQKMRDLRTKSDLVNLRAGSVGQQQLEDLATAAARASVERAQLEESAQRAASLAKQGSSAGLSSVLDSPTVSRLREQESAAAGRLADLSSRYGPNYPGVRSARADLASTQGQLAGETQRIVASLNTQLAVARAHEADVKQQLDRARQAAVQTSDAQAELHQLEQDAAARRQVYQSLLEQVQKTDADPKAAQMPDVRVLSSAVPSGFPSAPNMTMSGAFGLLGGGILGCLIALGRIRSVDGFGTSAEVTQATGMPVFATVRRSGARNRLPARVGATLAGPEAEMMRLLRARLRAACRPGPARNIVFTCATRGPDAANVAAAFARVAAADGERVLLVEGDLRNPSLGHLLNHDDGKVVSVLDGTADWRDAIAFDRPIPVDMLLGGEEADDAHALLNGTGLHNLLVEARDDYNLVVLDAPPAQDADALALAQRADATVVVVPGRRARRAPTREAVERLAAVSRTPIVAVLVAPR